MTEISNNPRLGFSCVESEHLANSLNDLESAGNGAWRLIRCEPQTFWCSQCVLESQTTKFKGKHPDLESIYDQDVVLGFLGRSHVGDAICSTSLVRLLTTERNCRVFSARHRSTHMVFENNPYLAGFRNEERVALSPLIFGPGHIIQKLNRAFGFPIEPFAKGDVFLSKAELEWAWGIRGKLPRNKPIAVVIAGSRTSNNKFGSHFLPWQDWINLISNQYSVIQVAITDMSRLEETSRLSETDCKAWKPDQILDDCFILENLNARQFLSIFAIAGLFLGRNSAGAHVAAAMNVPSIIVVSGKEGLGVPEFPENIDPASWRHESFLYPYHNFLLV